MDSLTTEQRDHWSSMSDMLGRIDRYMSDVATAQGKILWVGDWFYRCGWMTRDRLALRIKAAPETLHDLRHVDMASNIEYLYVSSNGVETPFGLIFLGPWYSLDDDSRQKMLRMFPGAKIYHSRTTVADYYIPTQVQIPIHGGPMTYVPPRAMVKDLLKRSFRA